MLNILPVIFAVVELSLTIAFTRYTLL